MPKCSSTDVNHTALLDLALDGRRFVAYSYLGNLATNVFGWNDRIAFTLNYVSPAHALLGGLGECTLSVSLESLASRCRTDLQLPTPDSCGMVAAEEACRGLVSSHFDAIAIFLFTFIFIYTMVYTSEADAQVIDSFELYMSLFSLVRSFG